MPWYNAMDVVEWCLEEMKKIRSKDQEDDDVREAIRRILSAPPLGDDRSPKGDRDA